MQLLLCIIREKLGRVSGVSCHTMLETLFSIFPSFPRKIVTVFWKYFEYKQERLLKLSLG